MTLAPRMSPLFICLLSFVISAPRALAQPADPQPSWEQKRLERMKFDQIVSALAAREGHRIADVGAGDGPFSIPLARLVGSSGMVYAVDVNDDVLDRLRKRITGGGLKNVEVVRGAEDNPKLPEGALDGVLLVDTYH